MEQGDRAKRLRIYLSSTDKLSHMNLYETIVLEARKSGIAGATVFRGIMGYGASSELYSNKTWELSEKVPLIVEIIDEPAKIDSFYEKIESFFDQAGKGHIITMDETIILKHKAGNKLT